MPWMVATISCSSSRAGTTTATHLPSSMSGAPQATFAGDRDDRTDDQADQRADDERRSARVSGRLHRPRRLDHLGALDLLRKCELLLQRLLLRDQVPEARLGVVLLADDHELLQRV